MVEKRFTLERCIAPTARSKAVEGLRGDGSIEKTRTLLFAGRFHTGSVVLLLLAGTVPFLGLGRPRVLCGEIGRRRGRMGRIRFGHRLGPGDASEIGGGGHVAV